MINGLFFLLVMEAARQVQSLARYRFLLSCELGSEPPVWRWELFKTTSEGSIRQWTNPLNVFLGLFAIGASVASFFFVNPAVGNPVVNVARWFSAAFTIALVIAVFSAGWVRRRQNEVADPPPAGREPLGPQDRPTVGVTYGSLRPKWARRDMMPPAAASTPAMDTSTNSSPTLAIQGTSSTRSGQPKP
jgi:hypothetical protein